MRSRFLLLIGAAVILSGIFPASSACAETKWKTDVSEEFSADTGEGIIVGRITGGENGSMLSYYDIETQDAIYGDIYANARLDGETWGIERINIDGGGSEVVMKRRPATGSTKRFDMSSDGKFITYTKENSAEGGWDIYGFRCGRGKIKEIRITRENHGTGETPKVKTSPAVYCEKEGRYAVAFSIKNRLFVAFSDADTDAPGKYERPLEIELTDDEKNVSFHRIRLNPRYPNILMYRRNTASKDAKIKTGDDRASRMYVIDWTKKNKRSIAWYDHKQGGPHPAWSCDGEKIGLQQDGTWTEFTVAANGEIVEGLSPETAEMKQKGPFSASGKKYPAIFYGTYSKNGKLIAVATDSETDEGGKIYLVDAATGDVRYLCRSLFHGPENDGQPRIRFVNGDKNIVFSTDKSYGKKKIAPPQVYIIESRSGELLVRRTSSGRSLRNR